MPSPTGNIFIDTLAGISWLDAGGDRNITYYFDQASTAHVWTPFEIATWQSALQQWANVANITTQRLSSSAGADLYEEWTTSSFMQANHSDSTLPAYQNLPNGSPPVTGDFNTLYAFSYWSPNDLSPGGIGYRLFVHEIGHGLGLVHPHGSEVLPGPRPVFPGVTGVSDLGTLGYNQEIYSIMSYNYGTASNSGSNTYGHAVTPMAFDIAAIQSLYGPNTNYHAGADTYVLPDANGTGNGTFWQCIWDTGGIDTIRYDGKLNATIDLRAATLVNGDPIAGGAVSQVASIFGGLTIANGVVIENASGGSGNDTIVGNSADNVLNGNAGDDTVVYFGNRSSYSVQNLGDKIVVSGPDGTDTLLSIEHVRFADATINTVSDTPVAAPHDRRGCRLGAQRPGEDRRSGHLAPRQ
jgi:serralysin